MIAMPDLSHFIMFAIAALILNLIPGTDVLYVASQSLRSKKQGLVATLGVSTGCLAYVFLTTMGLTAILSRSIVVFDLVKFAGAGYLFYLAWKLWRQPQGALHVEEAPKAMAFQSYYRGVCTNLCNPKVGLFFLTFLPQFVDVAQGHVPMQILIFGLYFIVSGTLVNLLYVLLFVHLKDRVLTHFPLQKWLNKISACLFSAIALEVLVVKQGG